MTPPRVQGRRGKEGAGFLLAARPPSGRIDLSGPVPVPGPFRPVWRRRMPYSAEISRTNPTCFLFLIDQSSSMLESFAGQAGKSKADGVADAINRLLQNLAIKCAKSDGIRDYFFI